MREIKFRAWDERLSQMMYGDGEWHKVNGGNEEIVYSSAAILHEFGDNVMQFTGLKDKNGTEIYEGDIVTGNTSFENYNDEREWTNKNPYVVGWSKECAGFMPFILNTRWRCDVLNIEVIGNIYENSDLLNQGSGSQTCDATEDQPGNQKPETK